MAEKKRKPRPVREARLSEKSLDGGFGANSTRLRRALSRAVDLLRWAVI